LSRCAWRRPLWCAYWCCGVAVSSSSSYFCLPLFFLFASTLRLCVPSSALLCSFVVSPSHTLPPNPDYNLTQNKQNNPPEKKNTATVLFGFAVNSVSHTYIRTKGGKTSKQLSPPLKPIKEKKNNNKKEENTAQNAIFTLLRVTLFDSTRRKGKKQEKVKQTRFIGYRRKRSSCSSSDSLFFLDYTCHVQFILALLLLSFTLGDLFFCICSNCSLDIH
jgi:hypothetical protein